MEQFSVTYQVTVSEFRQATYYGLFLRHRKALRIMFVVLIVAVLYALGAAFGLGKLNPLVLFLGAAYLIWGLMLFTGAEKGIRRYLRSDDSLIGCTYEVELDKHRFRLEIPERSVRFSVALDKLACAFELSSLFLIYANMQDAYILPTRCLSEEQRAALRQTLRGKLKDNFSTRFK